MKWGERVGGKGREEEKKIIENLMCDLIPNTLSTYSW